MAIAAVLSFLQQSILESPLQSLAATAFIVPIVYIIINEFIRASARVPGLKGPRGLPLIGNLAQIRKNAAEQYRVWSKTHGPVYQIQLGNIPVVVVNSAAAAKVLFGHNAQALSSRPEFYTFHKVSSRQHASLGFLHCCLYFFPLSVGYSSQSCIRLYQILLAQQSGLPHIVSHLRDAEKVPLQPSIVLL